MILNIDTSVAAVYVPFFTHVCRIIQGMGKLKKVRVEVRTGPGGQRSRIKTIRGLEPMAGEFEFTNGEGRPTTVKVGPFYFLP
jgi:hypothetical protein